MDFLVNIFNAIAKWFEYLFVKKAEIIRAIDEIKIGIDQLNVVIETYNQAKADSNIDLPETLLLIDKIKETVVQFETIKGALANVTK